MRKLLLFSSLLALVALPAALAAKPKPQDAPGSVSVRTGRGEIVLQVRGAVIGRMTAGKLTLTDDAPYDEQAPDVRGRLRGHPRQLSDATTVYQGRQIRFRVMDGSYRLKIDGTGINLSAVGHGWVVLQGDVRYENPGTYSLNGQPYEQIPYERTQRLKLTGESSSTPPRLVVARP
jgi:hypothetical protein